MQGRRVHITKMAKNYTYAELCWRLGTFLCLQKKGIPIEQSQVDAVIAAEGEAAVEMLQAIYAFIQSPGYE